MNLKQLLQTALVLCKQGQTQKALNICEQLLRQYPKQPDALHIAAISYIQLNDMPNAITYLKKCLKVKKLMELELYLAECTDKVGDTHSALKLYKRLQAPYSSNIKVLVRIAELENKNKNFNDALKFAKQAQKQDKHNEYLAYLIGSIYFNANDYTNAIKEFERGLTAKSFNKQIRIGLANCHRELGFPDKALSYLDDIDAENEISEVTYLRGCLHYDKNEFVESELFLNDVLSQQPDNLTCHETLNKLYWETGKADQFLKSYNQINQNFSELPANYIVSITNQMILAGQLSEAENLINSSLKKHNNFSEFLRLKSQIIYYKNSTISEQHNSEMANLLMHINKTESGSNTRTLIDLSACFIREGDYKKAEKLLLKATKISQNNQEIWAMLSTCWRLSNNAKKDWLVDYDRFLGNMEMDFSIINQSKEQFLADLCEVISNLHNMQNQPLDQSVKNGSQTMGHLFNHSNKMVQQVKELISDAQNRFLSDLKVDSSHPFLKNIKNPNIFFGSWSVLLTGNGYHTNHIHPDGWLSGPAYISLPNEVKPEDKTHKGWIKLGETSLKLGSRENIDKVICPQEGHCVFFPSYFWHGTIPTESLDRRITIPYDIRPRLIDQNH